jgi:hypothetical protein
MAQKGFITKDGLNRIKNHKYVSGSATYLDAAYEPFWRWFTL